ncbi:MAG TPA: hypothetical protein VFU86_02385 [Terriglobales bacterium]|nr:hypothetical protein [Terriglobales bacterium]
MANRYFFKALSFLQFFIFLIFFVAGLYLFAMSMSPRAAEFGEASTVEKHAFAAIAVSLFFLGPLIGIWRRQRWGWWSGLAINLICLGIAYWVMIYKQSDIGFGAVIWPTIFFVTVILHLLSRPASWKAISRSDSVLFKKVV